MVPRLRRRGRHPGPCPSAVPGADERPAPHLRHHLPEPERRATRRRGGGPGEGRQRLRHGRTFLLTGRPTSAK
ncbi:hypothetical protein FJT64_024576 [Amphibalanus amphitrite]|uniref:Uncharacterized protein n=1 Tax=Amphibalanus amphitrite TaxID=1232801 RepID=A0A6A4WMR9_AMPAM|nr:hypothetical protein FJT64_024576 [Amphibalanus amphitrite]